MLNIVDQGGDHTLMIIEDALLHLLGAQAVVHPDDTYDRDVDGRQDIRRHSQKNKRSQQQQHQRRHHKGVGTMQGEFDNPHGYFLLRKTTHAGRDGFAWNLSLSTARS